MEGLDDHLEHVVGGKRRISLADGQGGEELDENSEGGYRLSRNVEEFVMFGREGVLEGNGKKESSSE